MISTKIGGRWRRTRNGICTFWFKNQVQKKKTKAPPISSLLQLQYHINYRHTWALSYICFYLWAKWSYGVSMPPLTDFLQILHCTSPFSSDAIASIKKKISRKLYKPKCKSSTDLAITWLRILSKMKTFLSHFGIYIWHLRFLHPPVIWTLRQVNCPQVIQGSGSDLQTLAELTLCQQVWLAGRELDSQLS